MNYKKEIRRIYKALGITPSVERSHYELETNKSPLARDRGRQMGSTSKEPSCKEETPTTKS